MKHNIIPYPESLLYKSWQSAKEPQPDALVLVRTSDSYITYHDDASTIAELYGELPLIPATHDEGEVVMKTYFPRHTLMYVLQKLMDSGKRIIFCE